MLSTFGQTSDIGLTDAFRALSKAFGGDNRVNLFWDHSRRKYYAGRFTRDADEWARDEHGQVQLNEDGKPQPALPWKRAQVLYGEGETLEEALRFLTGGRVLVAYRPSFAKNGRITVIKSPSGLIVGRIPVPPARGDA